MKKCFPYFWLTLLIFLSYWNTFYNSFHFDDLHGILQVPWIRGLDKIPQFIFSFSHRPLLILSFNINYAISKFNVWSFHLFNILGHLLVTVLVYRLIILIKEVAEKKVQTGDITASSPFLAAVIFALHPLNTQAVTYISSRSAIMVTMFYLATLIFLFQGLLRRQQSASGSLCFFGAFICFACGALSKEIILTLPAMVFLFHFYFVSSLPFWRWLAQQLKWVVLAGGLLVGGIILIYLSHKGFLTNSPTNIPVVSYFLTETYIIPSEYFWKMFFPINLSIDIDFPLSSGWENLSSYGGLVFLFVYTATLIRVSRTRSIMGFGMAWAIITLLPESSFVPLLDVAVEHRTYLPMVGFSIFISAVLCELTGRLRDTPRVFLAAWSGIFVILITFATGLVSRNAIWKDEITLWADTVQKAPNLIRPHNNLGEAYDKNEQYDEAIVEFENTLKIDPNYVFGLNNLGNIYGKKEQYWKAIEYFEKALAVKPDYAPAHYNLARAFHKVEQPQKAVEHYRMAIRDNPYLEEAYFNLAFLASDLHLYDESIRNFQHFLEGQPKHVRAHFGLGNAYLQSRQFPLALAEYQKAIEIDPTYVFPYINIATIYMQTGKLDEAIATYQKVLSIQPIAGVHKNLGLIYFRFKKDIPKALHHFEEALRLDPNQPEAQLLRGSIAELQRQLNASAPANGG